MKERVGESRRLDFGKINRFRRHGVAFLIGILLFAVGYKCFLLPSGSMPGGVSGVAGTLYVRFGIPAWFMMLLLNTPLVVAAYRQQGKTVALLSLVGATATSLATALPLVPMETRSSFLSAALGGAFAGCGTGILLRIRVTTGGTDLAAYLLTKALGLSVGMWAVILDTGVVLFSAILLRSFVAVARSAIAILFFAFLLDFVQKSTLKYLRF